MLPPSPVLNYPCDVTEPECRSQVALVHHFMGITWEAAWQSLEGLMLPGVENTTLVFMREQCADPLIQQVFI